MAEYHLNLDMCKQFLHDVLGIKDYQDLDRFELLSQISAKYQEMIPYQNITFMSSPVKQVQTLEEIINCVQKGYGGVCSDGNTFLFLLLKTLGYKADMLLSSVYYPGGGPHAITLIHDLKKKGDMWLVDTGAFHTFVPIDMSFEKESQVYHESFAAYKYVKRGDQYIRLQKPADALPIPVVEDGWGNAYYFDLKPVTPKQFLDSVDEIIYKGTQDWNWFHTLPVIWSWPNKRAVIFRKNYFVKEDENGKLSREYIKGDIAKAVKQQFPKIPEQQIKIAIAKSKAYQADQLKKKNAAKVLFDM